MAEEGGVKITIDLSDPETRAVWDAALRARREVEAWPCWKRGGHEPLDGKCRRCGDVDLPRSRP